MKPTVATAGVSDAAVLKIPSENPRHETDIPVSAKLRSVNVTRPLRGVKLLIALSFGNFPDSQRENISLSLL